MTVQHPPRMARQALGSEAPADLPQQPLGSLPRRAGISLKPEHYQAILETRPALGFFEVHAENYMVAGGPFHHYLSRIRQDYPLSVHGVGLSIGGEAALSQAHLERLASLLERYEPAMFSEHLAWSSHDNLFLNDLLPLAYTEQQLQRVCEHIDQVQSRLKRRMLLENPATYLQFSHSELSETQFIHEVVRRTGCGLLLDVNNLYVSCTNHGWDPLQYLSELPCDQVGEIHLAGYSEDQDSLGAALLIDSHGSPVAEAVWTLYAQTLQRTGPMPVLIERDNDIPSLATLVAEARRADSLLAPAEATPT